MGELTNVSYVAQRVASEVQPRTSTQLPGDYISRVADLLLETAIVESYDGTRFARRQIGFSMREPGGAWGITQVELQSAAYTNEMMRDDVDLRHAAGRVVGFIPRCWETENCDDLEIGLLLAASEEAAMVYARLHYWRCPGLISDDVFGRANYWKVYYNTHLGKGTVSGYIKKVEDVQP